MRFRVGQIVVISDEIPDTAHWIERYGGKKGERLLVLNIYNVDSYGRKSIKMRRISWKSGDKGKDQFVLAYKDEENMDIGINSGGRFLEPL
jgi:hypothetical protein